jgi:outer membrane lipoprotein-sorting protein
VRALVAALAVLVAGGCARVPEPGEPISAPELDALVAALDSHLAHGAVLRGTGSGEIVVSGRTLRHEFALVYRRPGLLRADLRPDVAFVGSSLTARTIMEDDCVRAYFPARLVEVRGCFEDVFGDLGIADPPGFLVGFPDPSYLARLDDPTSAGGDGSIVVTGTYGGRLVTTTIDAELGVVLGILVEEPGDERVQMTYEGHGWKDGLPAPRSMKLRAFEGTTREVRFDIAYDSLRTSTPLEPDELRFEVPPGVRVLTWEDLLSGR